MAGLLDAIDGYETLCAEPWHRAIDEIVGICHARIRDDLGRIRRRSGLTEPLTGADGPDGARLTHLLALADLPNVTVLVAGSEHPADATAQGESDDDAYVSNGRLCEVTALRDDRGAHGR